MQQISSRLRLYLTKLAGAVLAITATLAAIWIIGFLTYISTPNRVLRMVFNEAGRAMLRAEFDPASNRLSGLFGDPSNALSINSVGGASADKFASVSTDMGSVQNWIINCVKTIQVKSDNTASTTKSVDGDEVSVDGDPGLKTVLSRLLSPSESVLSYVNQGIGARRLVLDQRASRYTDYLLKATILTILVGMLTTIFVALSTSSIGAPGQRWSSFVKIMAITLPAFGTATTALIAFTNPQEEATRAATALATLDRLHAAIILNTASHQCIDANDGSEKDFAQVTSEWLRRFQEAQIAADTRVIPGARSDNEPKPSEASASSAISIQPKIVK